MLLFLLLLLLQYGAGERIIAIYLPRVDEKIFIAQLAILKVKEYFISL